MRLIRFGLVLLALFVLNSLVVAQKKNEGLVNWEVICVDGIKKGESIPCKGFQKAGASFSITRDLLINTGLAGTSVIITMAKRENDRRSLKILEIIPKEDKKNKNWEYKFLGGLQGPAGSKSNLYFVRLGFLCKNAQNSKNGRGGYCDDGPYNGKLTFKDTKSGTVFTLNLKVIVRSLKK